MGFDVYVVAFGGFGVRCGVRVVGGGFGDGSER